MVFVAVVRSAPVMSLQASLWTFPSTFPTETVPERRASELAENDLYHTGRAYCIPGTTMVWKSCRVYIGVWEAEGG